MDYVNRQYMGTYNPRTSHEPNIIYQPILIPIISPYIWLRFFHTIPSKHHKNIYWNHSHKTSMWTCVYVQVWLPHPEPKIRSIPQMHWFHCRKMLRIKNWLVVYLPLWKIWKSMGRMNIPYMKWKIKNVWNHQPEKDSCKGRILRNQRNADRCLSSAVHATAMSWLAETIIAFHKDAQRGAQSPGWRQWRLCTTRNQMPRAYTILQAAHRGFWTCWELPSDAIRCHKHSPTHKTVIKPP